MFLQKNPPKSKKTQSLSMDVLNGGIDPVGGKDANDMPFLSKYPAVHWYC